MDAGLATADAAAQALLEQLKPTIRNVSIGVGVADTPNAYSLEVYLWEDQDTSSIPKEFLGHQVRVTITGPINAL